MGITSTGCNLSKCQGIDKREYPLHFPADRRSQLRGKKGFVMHTTTATGSGTDRTSSIGVKQLVCYFICFGAYCLLVYFMGAVLGKDHAWTSLFLLYISFANIFVPLPTNPMIILLGRTHDPIMIAALGAVGTMVANLSEYHILAYISARKFADRIKKRKFYMKFQEWYYQYPFLLLVLTNFLPLPVDPVRWLSISSGYSRSSFALATIVGRAPRYYLLALLGEKYQVPNWILLLLVVIPATYSIVKFLLKKLRPRI